MTSSYDLISNIKDWKVVWVEVFYWKLQLPLAFLDLSAGYTSAWDKLRTDPPLSSQFLNSSPAPTLHSALFVKKNVLQVESTMLIVTTYRDADRGVSFSISETPSSTTPVAPTSSTKATEIWDKAIDLATPLGTFIIVVVAVALLLILLIALICVCVSIYRSLNVLYCGRSLHSSVWVMTKRMLRQF